MYFVAIVEHDKKELKKTSENSYLQSLFNPFLVKNDVAYEWLGAAFRNLVDIFCSYIRDFVLWTDASLCLGLAYTYGGRGFTYAISPINTKEKIDIFFLELVAILSAVHHVALFQNPPKKVLLWTDSLNYVASYSSLHATESLHNLVLLALAGILLQTGMDLHIRHIAGKVNIKADLLSRLMIDEFYRRFPSESVCLFSPPRELLPAQWRECF